MKISSIILVLTCLLFNNCNDSSENILKTEAKEADSLLRILRNEHQATLTACDTLPAFRQLFSAVCPNDTISGIPISKHKKYPFDTLFTKAKDTIICSFKVSNECCVTYHGSYHLNTDTLILSYNFCGDACDCYCDYKLSYKISTKMYPYKHIRLQSAQDLPLPFNTN